MVGSSKASTHSPRPLVQLALWHRVGGTKAGARLTVPTCSAPGQALPVAVRPFTSNLNVMPYLAAIVLVIFFAGNILVGKALTELPPITVALMRLTVALAVLIPLGARSAYRNRDIFITHWKPFFIITLSGVTFFNTFIYSSLQFTSTTNVAVLESIIPTAAILFSVVFLGERLASVQWVGVVASLAGALWVVSNGQVLNLTQLGGNVGDGLMVGAIIAWVIYTLQLKTCIHLFPARALLFAMTAVSVAVLVPLAAVEWFVLGVPRMGAPDLWVGLIYLGVFPSVVAILCYNYAVSKIGAARTALFLNFLPVFTIAGSYLFLGEEITGNQLVGSLLVIVGVLLVTQTARDGHRIRERPRKYRYS